MKFSSIASGSKGNCLLYENNDVKLLVDAGISKKRIEEGMSECGSSLEEVNGILITHEHSDHISGLGVVSRKYHIPIYATKGTISKILEDSKVGTIDRNLFNEIEENTTNENKEFNEKILIEIESYLKIKENTQMQIEDYKFLKAIAEELRRQEVRRTDISMPPLFVIKNSQGQEMFFITRKALNEYIECNKKSLSENKTIIEIPSNNSYELEKLIEIIKRNF